MLTCNQFQKKTVSLFWLAPYFLLWYADSTCSLDNLGLRGHNKIPPKRVSCLELKCKKRLLVVNLGLKKSWPFFRVSVQGVKSLGGHFACLCRGFEFYEVKKKKLLLFFKKKMEILLHFFIIFIVKSLQKEQNTTNLLLWPPICRNRSAITPKWFNSLDTNSRFPSFVCFLAQSL